MGYMRHHGMLVTSHNHDLLAQAHAEATRLEMAVSGMVESAMNGYHSFAVFPDGSKEGWPDDLRGDEQRDELKAWLEKQRYEDGSSPLKWVEVQYGDDAWETCVTDDSDDERRARAANGERDEE